MRKKAHMSIHVHLFLCGKQTIILLTAAFVWHDAQIHITWN